MIVSEIPPCGPVVCVAVTVPGPSSLSMSKDGACAFACEAAAMVIAAAAARMSARGLGVDGLSCLRMCGAMSLSVPARECCTSGDNKDGCY